MPEQRRLPGASSGSAAPSSRPEPEAVERPQTRPRIFFTDGVLKEIVRRLADRPPERGGVLLGLGNLAHTIVDDDHGDYSGGHWDVSDEVVAFCEKVQQSGRGTYLGQIHSHPRGVRDPSGPDRALMLDALKVNLHRDLLFVPVVSEGRARRGDFQLNRTHCMSTMVAMRTTSGLRIVRAQAEVVSVCEDLRQLGFTVGSGTGSRQSSWMEELTLRQITVGGSPRLAFRPPSSPVILLLDGNYPSSAPELLRRADDGIMLTRVRPWGPRASRVVVLRDALLDADRPDGEGEPRLDRVRPLAGDLSLKNVVVAGAGSVGSRLAEDLCRSGVGRFHLIDPDEVTAPNLARTVYVASDLGQPKVDVLAARLRAVNPQAVITTDSSPLGLLDLRPIVAGADLVVGATDDMEEQLLLNHHAYAAAVPMVSCALYRQARAGEVILSVPAAKTSCARCAMRDLDLTLRPDKDYGAGGRLVAEPGLGPSIQLVASYASILAIGLLAGPATSAGQQVRPLLRTRRTYGKIATTANWDFFPGLLGTAGHQHAPQSVWIRVPADDNCSVCGTHRVPPIAKADALLLAEYVASAGYDESRNDRRPLLATVLQVLERALRIDRVQR